MGSSSIQPVSELAKRSCWMLDETPGSEKNLANSAPKGVPTQMIEDQRERNQFPSLAIPLSKNRKYWRCWLRTHGIRTINYFADTAVHPFAHKLIPAGGEWEGGHNENWGERVSCRLPNKHRAHYFSPTMAPPPPSGINRQPYTVATTLKL